MPSSSLSSLPKPLLAWTQLREEREQKKALKSMTRQQLELYRRAKHEARRLVQAGLDARRASRQQQRLLAARGVGGRGTAELATWAARALDEQMP